MTSDNFASSENIHTDQAGHVLMVAKSLIINKINNDGPKTDPCRTPLITRAVY